MDDNILQMVLEDAKAHRFTIVRFGGVHNGVPYFVYEKEHTGRYVGLPCVIRIVDGSIEYVSDVAERFMAYRYKAPETEQSWPTGYTDTK